MLSPEKQGLVYFVSSDDDNLTVKIGMTKKCALTRLVALQVSHANKLHLLGVTRGGRVGEAYWHSYFAERRIRGEWFDFGDFDIENFLSKCEKLEDMPITVRNSLPVKVGICSCMKCAVEKLEKLPSQNKRCKFCTQNAGIRDCCKKCMLHLSMFRVAREERNWK